VYDSGYVAGDYECMENWLNRMEQFWSKLKKIKADKLLMVLLVGILLLVICIPVKSGGSSSTTGSGYSDGVLSGAADTEASVLSEESNMVSADSLETQLEELLQKIDGVGQVKVMITANSEYNQIEGVVVVAEGADLPQVRQEIIETAQALFPIAAYKVKVCKMAGGQE
jgi:hypothetical protein